MADSTSPPEGDETSRRRRFLTPDQVAEELNVSRVQVMALIKHRDVRAIQIGGRGQWRIERAELEAYIARLYEQWRRH